MFVLYVMGDCRMGLMVALVPKDHWSVPEWIDEEKAKRAREDMEQRNIIYGGSLPYRHMCRFQSGFFWRHEMEFFEFMEFLQGQFWTENIK